MIGIKGILKGDGHAPLHLYKFKKYLPKYLTF